MGLRSRLKHRVKRALGKSEDHEGAVGASVAAAGAAGTAAAATGGGAAGAAGTAASDTGAAVPTPPPGGSASSSSPVPAAGRIDPDKKRMARLKAKKAVLQYLIKEGGEANMGAMHDFSERRYFVAHKAFSDLMEEFLAEELIDFDEQSYQATITAEGRRWVESATHIKTREKM